MSNKKQTGGLGEDNQDLIQPGDQELNTNNLINTVSPNTEQDFNDYTLGGSGLNVLSNMRASRQAVQPTYFQMDPEEYKEYDRLIDGPFSLLDSSIDDRRAEGQGLGEKLWNSYGVKLLPKIGSHVIGSTVGLIDGFGEVAKDAYENGFAASNWNKFFNNDFQRSLDDFNKSLDEKYPIYATSQERDLGFWQSTFGKGAANFWTDEFSQGLSFVAGAVLSEFATAGVGKFMLPATATKHLKRISALRNTAYAQKSTSAVKMLNKISRADRIYDGLVTGRRLMTGAFYEAGVEARHNYDATVQRLSELYSERNDGEAPSASEMAKIKDIAVKVSNGVFAGNAALVGYSNMLLFRNIFGSGMKANKKFKNKIYKDDKGVYKAKHKDWGRMRSFLHRNVYGQGAWGRYAAYEGLVEEGGQKTMDIAGQYAAESMYIDGKTPGQIEAVGEILNHTFDGMAEAYGSTEGQKEIFLGFVLAALGLPSFVSKNEKGETSFKLGYGKVGGVKDYLSQYAENQKEVEDLVTYMNENPEAMEAIKNNFDMLNGISEANDKRDYADATNNDFAYKNADQDAFFAYAFARIKGGYFGDVLDSIEDMRGMDLDSFESMFNYEEETQNMSKKERENFLTERRNKVVDTHLERANKIKEIYDSLDSTKLGPDAKKMIAQALSSTADLDAREQKLIQEVEETGGFTLTAVVNKKENDKQSNDNVFTKIKNFTMRKLGRKGKDVMENSETGREVKREIGIKEFTEPGHPGAVFTRMMEKLAALKKQRDIYEANDDVDGYIEVTEQIENLENEAAELANAINNQTAPNISEEEQQILDEYQQRDPSGYERNKEDIIKKLQDLRRIRAKRHQMLNLIQKMIDPEASKDKIQEFEMIVQDMLTEEEKKNLPPEEQRLARKYKGKIIEFEYTNKKGETHKHRVYFKDSGTNGLVRLPNEETFKLLQRKNTLLKKRSLTEDDKAELELIEGELARNEHVVSKATYNPGILSRANNIKVMTEQELLLNRLQAVTSVLQDGFAENLGSASQQIIASKEKLVEIAKQIKQIKSAIKQAKTDSRGRVHVNLNSIGRRGGFSIQTAKGLIAELKIEEANYKELLKQFVEDMNTLEDNSLRIQVIQTALSNPNIVSNLLDRNVTQQDVFEVINDLLGLTSNEEFYKQLGESGFFNTNELTKLAGKKNKDGGYDVDNQLLQELLTLADQDNITKDYLDLMNTDLEHFRKELELLTQHRSDVERMLNKMVNPETGEVTLFPEEGLTEEDLRYLQTELRLVDADIDTIQSIIDMMEAEADESMRNAANSNLLTERQRATGIQQELNNKIQEFINFINAVQIEEAEQANIEDGETITTLDDVAAIESQSRREFSPSLSRVGFTKTQGNHLAALQDWQNTYESMIEEGAALTEAEQKHLEHVKAQLRFFRASYDVVDWTKKTGNKLQIVTRYNIRPEWKDKIIFFDIARAEKSGRYDDLNNYQYADNLTPNENRNEKLEDIKLLLVDANNQPVLVDGELVYTNMSSSDINNSRGEFKGNELEDKDTNGNLKDVVNNAREAFINERNKILKDNEERFFYIKNKSRGLTIKQGGEQSNYGDVKSPVRGRLKVRKRNKQVIAKEEDLKNIRLEMKLPPKGTKGANQKMPLFGRFLVSSRFVYFGTESKGYNGNLIPGLISNLSENRVNNIYNLSRYFAENQVEGGVNIGGKGFTTILKEQIMYGDRSKERERQEFSIYMQEDAIFFGDQGQSITLEELKDPEKYKDKHDAYKTFLSNLFFNVNSTLLNKDKKARVAALKAKGKTNRFIEPQYEKFNEVIVNDDLSTDVIEWDNYTHYLISDRNRAEEDIPVRVDMPLGFNEAPGVKQWDVPQFLNVYLEHRNEALTAEEMASELNDINRKVNRAKPEVEKEVIESNDEYKIVELIDETTGEKFKVKVLVDKEKAKEIIGEEVEDIVNENKPEDTLEGSPFSQSNENPDDIFFLESMSEDRGPEINVTEEIEWFNTNVPRDSKGNPLFTLDWVKGLIDDKAFGKFTKDNKILLSDLLDTPGIIYHETWHAVTRRLLSKDDRFTMYSEVRGMRGSTQTYKGDTKKMSELTDKEADEWLAEEFREYVLSGGNYTLGGRIKKSLLDKIFDRIFNILNYFRRTSQAEKLMSRINSGYYANPTKKFTIYDNKSEAYYEATELTATMRNDVMEGMTVLLFNKALKSNEFNLEDFVDPKAIPELKEKIANMYGSFNTTGTVYSQLEAYIKDAIVKNPESTDVLTRTMSAIRNNWNELKEDHVEYLKRFLIDISEEVEELEKTREQFSKPQNEIDPSTYLPKAVRVLLATLPSSYELNNGIRVSNKNTSGLPKLVDFGNLVNFMYKEFANIDPSEFLPTLKTASEKRPELKSLINRLGLDSEDISDKSFNQLRLIVQTMMQFNQSNNTFYTQLITRDGGRKLIDSNQNKVSNKIKLLWTNQFKDRIQNNEKLGKEVNGELILNSKAKVKVGDKNKTFRDWATDVRRTAGDSLQILDKLGITFTNSTVFNELYNDEFTGVRDAIDYILLEVYNKPVSDIFKGDIRQNLNTLINLETEYNPTIVDLQHINPDGKVVHGVNLKTYADTLISKLNKADNKVEIENLLSYDNLKGSYYLNTMLETGADLNIVVIDGIEQTYGRGKSMSKGSPVDIGSVLINSVLGSGIVPLIRTADKKTEFGVKFGHAPNLNVAFEDMLQRLQKYLQDELRTASKFNSKRKSKLHRIDTIKDKGGNLRFFQGLVPSIGRTEYGKNLSELELSEIVSRDTVVDDLKAFLESQVIETKATLLSYNIAPGGIDNKLLQRARMKATELNSNPMDILAEQFTYEYMTGIIEQSKLFLGDLALYTDLFKRTSGISGTKAYPTSDLNILEWMNTNMPNLLSDKNHSENLRVSHRAPVKTEAPYLDQYIDTLIALGASTEFQDTVFNTYSNMEEFDGGGFITLDAYRSLMYRVGKWTPSQEEFYQKIAKGEVVSSEDIALIPPIKPQFFGPQIVDNVRLMTFHKFALFPIVPGMTLGKAFDEINRDMINNDIDYMIFESAAKVGGVTAGQVFVDEVDNPKGYDPFYEKLEEFNTYKPMSLDVDGQPLGLQELNFSDLGIQVEAPLKIKDTITEGSQSRSLLPINIYNEGELSPEYKDFENLIDRYHEVNNALVSRDFQNLVKKLKLYKDPSGIYKLKSEDVEEFKRILLDEFRKRENPRHTIESIKELLDSDTKFIEQLFEKNKIENLLYSLVNNNVVKRKMPGGQFVLQASTGFENKLKAIKQNDFELAKKKGLDLHDVQLKPLKFYRKEDPNNPNSETLAMQVYLPSRFKDQMGLTIEDVNNPNLDPNLLQLIGFRIPTEGLNSMDFIEVVGFLPKSFGDTVIVPSEIVGKAGSDYDIDKLNIYFPNADKETGRRIQLDPDKSIKQQSKKALQNELQTIIRDVLSHPASFDQLISPVGAWKLKDLAKEIAMLRNPSAFDSKGNKIVLPLHQTFSLESMINTSHRMFSGLGGIGIVATSSTQHAKGQRPGINWNFTDKDINFNFEGEGFSLSRVYDIRGKEKGDKISATIGQYVTGYVDVTKEDFVFDINAGIEYAPIHMLLVRSGVPLESVVYFMSQPIIDEYVTAKNLNQPIYSSRALKSNDKIAEELRTKYGKESSNTKLNANLLKSMIGKKDLNPLENQVQVQVLNDFLMYKDLAEDLLLLKDATSLETTNYNNSIAIRYAKQAIKRLEESGMFLNLDELLYGNEEGASTTAGYTNLLNEVDGLFAEFKLGEYLVDAKEFIDNKMFELMDKDLKPFKDDILYKMQKFENFIASSIVQNTSWDYGKIKERTSELFKGKNSLPRRVNNLKKISKYKNNLLMQELTPVLQVFNEDSKESTIDGLRLFSKKLQSYDIDLLADAFMELKEINPILANDLIIFSALQSGYNFSPGSFFQAIPGSEVLSVLSKYFKQNKKEDRKSNLIHRNSMPGLWEDFNQNYHKDAKVVRSIFRREVPGRVVNLYEKAEYVNIAYQSGEKTIGGETVSIYEDSLYKNTGRFNEKDQAIFTQINKKGVKNQLIEATGVGVSSIVNKNNTIKSEDHSEAQIANTSITLKKNVGGERDAVIKDKTCK